MVCRLAVLQLHFIPKDQLLKACPAVVAEQAKASLPEDNMVLLEAQVHCAMQEHEAVRARLLEKENELVSAKGHVSELQCRTVEACATIAGLHKEIEGGAARLLLTEDSLAAAQAASAKQVCRHVKLCCRQSLL